MRSLLKRRSRQVEGPRETIGHVVLTFRVHEADGYLVADCEQLGVSSFGSDLDEALRAGVDAACVYLNEITAQGEVLHVLKERGVELHPGAPGEGGELDEVHVTARPGDVIASKALDIPGPALAGIG